ncbi:MAG: translation initiation factor IF-2 [Candidatus Omnitrophica bacterium]|nr:translation initiation factor IF-2 [Candidatus Omnitrophota bacterium]
MRINQIARKYGLENKAIIDYLESIGVRGKSHSSSLDEGTIELLLQHFGKVEPKESEKPEKPSRRFAKIRRPKNWKPSKKEEAPVEVRAEASDELQAEQPETVETEAMASQETPVEAAPAEAVAPETLKSDESQKTSPVVEPPAESASVEAVPADIKEASSAESAQVEEKEAKEAEAPAPLPKKDESKKAKKVKDKRPDKRAKTKAIPLDAIKEHKGEPEIIIEAPELDLTSLEDKSSTVVDLEPEEVKEKTRVKGHDEDEAIRREIQKLKMKQRRAAEPEEAQEQEPEEPVKSEAAPRGAPRRRPQKPSGRGKKGKMAWKREKRERREQQIAAEVEKSEREKTILKIHDASTVADVANGLGVSASELIQKLISMGVMVSINQPLEFETIQIIADDYGFHVEKVDLFDNDIFTQLWQEDTLEERMVTRSPVVTIMGHVDHGKTKLLDAVRQSDIASHEAGGITQHIGAYLVNTKGGLIAFLDTPGHEAFTAMRARGAMVTDIVILVVSAADGVMPQTIEAIHHAKAAGVPIIVAVNKMDLENANPDRVKQQLSEYGLTPEEWGGQTIMAPISALKKEGIDDLLETVLLQAELLELKADPMCRARGTIVEGRLEQGRGPVATILIQQGRLKVGDPFVTGVYSGRVRAMQNERGEMLEEAGPSTPVEILGIEDVPSAGDPFIVVKDDNQAKQISARLQQIQRERDMRRTRHVTLDDLHSQIQEGAIKELNVIVKGDVQGSVGAVSENLLKIESEKVRIEIIHSGVGAISESDVMLASASNAVIIGFNVRPHPHVTDLAKREHVDIRTYRIIYQVISDVKNAMEGMLDKTYEERILGRGEVREVFRLSRGLSIAGLYIQNGRLLRNAPVRLLRDSVVVHEGSLSSLRRFKEDVREVQSGFECGIGLENFNDIREGDVIECYQMDEVAPTL